MMIDIEQQALKEYPVIMSTLIPTNEEHGEITQDCNRFLREAYVKGYKQALKDIKE